MRFGLCSVARAIGRLGGSGTARARTSSPKPGCRRGDDGGDIDRWGSSLVPAMIAARRKIVDAIRHVG